MKISEWQTFIVAIIVIVGGGWMLSNPGTPREYAMAILPLLGAVVTYFFSRQVATNAAASVVAAATEKLP